MPLALLLFFVDGFEGARLNKVAQMKSSVE